MKVTLNINQQIWTADLNQPISLALGFGPGAENPNAFHINPANLEPIRVGTFVGAVSQGSGANCEVITFCAHGNGTHTECVGHITPERISVFPILVKPNLTAQLITVVLSKDENGNSCIDLDSLNQWKPITADAIIIRTSPNPESKKQHNWSGQNPPYFTVEAMDKIVKLGYNHLLTDLPSVDPEEDNGALSAHRVWWSYPENTRMNATITELIYVPNEVLDGLYYLQLSLPKIFTDAVPSNPIIYPLESHV